MALTSGQQRCVETLDRPLVVAAGAGSGKTFTLTQRIAGALENGYVSDIDEVCAITFTNKAAAELKSRIKAELRSRGLVEQALRVDEAWVSTIHGMCARILRAHALELGIDPAFRVAEGAEVAGYLDRAIDAVLAAEQETASSPQVDALFAEYAPRSSGGFGVSVESMLAELVTAASAQADGVGSFVMPGISPLPALAVEQAIGSVESLVVAAESEKEGPKRDDWLAATDQALQDARDALASGINGYDQALRVLSAFKLAKTFGSKDYKARVDEAKGILTASTMEVRLGAARGHLETLVELARRVLDEFSSLKRADGVLDNNDLLVLAARAIEEHPRIAAQYTDKFKLIMVDEFQDTDQMQVDMIKRLAGEDARRLCVVGDAQQSIYRFRGADVSVYRRHLQSVRASWPDSVIELSDNFRSHGDVLAFVDRVFEKPAMFGGEFMSLSAGRDESRVSAPFSDAQPRIVVQHTTRPWRGVDSQRAVRAAAERIADQFAALAAKGHAPGEMVVLLGRMSHADVYAQALRDKGLPCVVSGGSVFARTLEAQVMQQLTRVLANPRESQSLFNVLTSPMFALTAGDLLEVGGLEGFWRAAYREDGEGDGLAHCHSEHPSRHPEHPSRHPEHPSHHREHPSRHPEHPPCHSERSEESPRSDGFSPQLACALQVLSCARDSIGLVPVSRLMEQVVESSGWLSRMQAQGAEGLASAGNVFKAIRMVRSIERSGAYGPATIARRFAESLAGSKEAPGALSVSGGDSVRIMTIHASKGLEFPIVAVAEVKENRAPSSRLLVTSMGKDVYVSLDLGRTLDAVGDTVDDAAMAQVRDYVLGLAGDEEELAAAVAEDAGAVHRRLAMRGYLAAGDQEEAKRLVYVALTRAKEALVVSSVGVSTKANPAGIPKSALAGVFDALGLADSEFDDGRSVCDFGGAQPAIVECVSLKAEDVEDAPEPGQADDMGATFMVPAVEWQPALPTETYKPLHQGIFSYSSISDAAHEGDVLDRLAEAHAVSVDAGLVSGADTFVPADVTLMPTDDAPVTPTPVGARFIAPAAEGGFHSPSPSSFDDDFWDFDVSQAFDEDRATDLGTAFHRLAQFAVVARGGEGPLAMPPAQRIEALCRTCNLDAEQRMRLNVALQRWFGCDVARDMATLSDLAPEVPFFVAVPGGEENAYLEGEIDLLGFDDTRAHATVVDYKTGGHDNETSDDLRRKHVLQAACYAYAIMLQGVETVEAIFVRVERPRADDPAQPQCVRYRFQQADIPNLASIISQVYKLTK